MRGHQAGALAAVAAVAVACVLAGCTDPTSGPGGGWGGSTAAADATPATGHVLGVAEAKELGAVLATLAGPDVRVHVPVWEDREMRMVRLPVVLTNTGERPAVVRAKLTVYAQDAVVWTGMLDSGQPVKAGASVVEDIEVGSVRDLASVRVELSGAAVGG